MDRKPEQPFRRLEVFQQICSDKEESPVAGGTTAQIPASNGLIQNTPSSKNVNSLPKTLLGDLNFCKTPEEPTNANFVPILNRPTNPQEIAMNVVNFPVEHSIPQIQPRAIVKTEGPAPDESFANIKQEVFMSYPPPRPILNNRNYQIEPPMPYIPQTSVVNYIDPTLESSLLYSSSGPMVNNRNPTDGLPLPYMPQIPLMNNPNHIGTLLETSTPKPMLDLRNCPGFTGSLMNNLISATESPIPKPIINNRNFGEFPVQMPTAPIINEPNTSIEPLLHIPRSVFNTVNYPGELAMPCMPVMDTMNPCMNNPPLQIAPGLQGNVNYVAEPPIVPQQINGMGNMNNAAGLLVPPGFQWPPTQGFQEVPTPQNFMNGNPNVAAILYNHNAFGAASIEAQHYEMQSFQSNINPGDPTAVQFPEPMFTGSNNQIEFPALPPAHFTEGVNMHPFQLQPPLELTYRVENDAAARYMYEERLRLFEMLARNNSPAQLNDSSQTSEVDGAIAQPAQQQEPETPACALPDNFDNYMLGERIGTGSFSNLYRAYDRYNNIEVAIKCYMPTKNRDHFVKAANEIAFLKMLNHPHVLSCISANMKKQYCYLGIPYSPHGSLRNFMQQGVGLSELTVQGIMRELLTAVYYFHSMHIFHGNITPDNIMVVEVNNLLSIKLANFESAQVCMQNQSISKKSEAFFYMAPEVNLGYPVDYRSDLFSCGIVMYEMLYGCVPYPIQIPQKQFLKLLKERRPIYFPDFETGMLSDYCIHLLRNLLSYDKNRRFSGVDLLTHPFVNVNSVKDEHNHFRAAYGCYLRSTDLALERHFGLAYIEVTQAVLHLQIIVDQVGDRGLHELITSKLNKYQRYCQIFQERMVSDYINTPLMMPRNTERLRTLLLNTPQLLMPYDLCIVGEMYFRLDDPCGKVVIRKGLDAIMTRLLIEPNGPRKVLLAEKIEQWMRILGIS